MTSRLLLLTLLVAGFATVVDHVRPAGAQPRMVMMASTIGPVDAGIVAALEDAYLRRTGVMVRHVGAGTGAALEDKFVADGFGVDRRDVMYNDFVILGPAGDPARIRGEKKAIDALRKIAGAQAPFLTRGDRSGTHVKEVELWEAAAVSPQGPWYAKSERGAAGNAATTRDANGRQVYVLMDRATYLTLKKKITLEVLVERDPALLNYIAVIRVNPAKHPKVNADGARAFQDWLVSEEAQRIIKGFEVDRYGEPLFFPNSDDWRKRFGGAS
jgi:tungstate transport system substrate-binding protein